MRPRPDQGSCPAPGPFTRRWAPWIRAAATAVTVSVGLAACNGCRTAGRDGPAGSPGAESPPTLRLYFVSDLAGAIEPCGCVKDQLGGLDHAAAWIHAEGPRAPASLLVAAGPTFFMDGVLEKDHRAQDIAKAEALASALGKLGFAGWAPAQNDWAAGAGELARLAQESAAPGLASNLTQADAGAALLPTRVVAVNALRVGLIGVGAPAAAAPPGGPSPAEAVRAASKAVRAEGANVVIVLASVGRGEAKRIADAVPDLTAIIVGDSSLRGDANTPSPPGELVGGVLIAETANHLQAVGVIDLYVRGDSYVFTDAGGLGNAQKRSELTRRIDELHFRIANWERDSSIAPSDLAARRADLTRLEADRARLDVAAPPAKGSYFRYALKEVREALGQDPAVKAALGSYYRFVNEANRVQLEGRLPPPVEPGQASYVGVQVCASCHAKQKQFWDKTPHARAYATLSSQDKEFNLDCVSCHVTGYGRPGGSTVTHVEKLKDVQCEVCHGPGSLHCDAPETVHLLPRGPDVCATCHHSPHVEGFDPLTKMNIILGPGHGQ